MDLYFLLQDFDETIIQRGKAYFAEGARPQAVLEHLEGLIFAHSVQRVLDFAFMVIEEAVRLLERGDDSDGGAGGVIEGCLESMDALYENRVSGPCRAHCAVVY